MAVFAGAPPQVNNPPSFPGASGSTPRSTTNPQQAGQISPLQFVPSGIPVKPGDTVALGVWSTLAAAFQIGVTFILVKNDGSKTWVDTPPLTVLASNRAQNGNNSLYAFTEEGVIQECCAYVTGGFPAAPNDPIQPGQVFVFCSMVDSADKRQPTIFLSDYIYEGHQPVMRRLISHAEGPGNIRNIHTASTALVAAGVGFGPPANARWRIIAFRIKYVASGSAGTRTILVYMTDGTTAPVSGTEGANVIEEWVNSGTFGTGRNVVASTTEIYKLTGLQTVDGSATVSKIMQTPFVMSSGQKLFIQDLAHIDVAGDTVVIDVFVEEWISGP